MTPTLSPERVGELAEVIADWTDPQRPDIRNGLYEALAPLVARWVAEAERWGDSALVDQYNAEVIRRLDAERGLTKVAALADEWEREADEDERWLNGPRVAASEAHEYPATIRQARAHATEIRAALTTTPEEQR